MRLVLNGRWVQSSSSGSFDYGCTALFGVLVSDLVAASRIPLGNSSSASPIASRIASTLESNALEQAIYGAPRQFVCAEANANS
jgi:hypothetical protein